MASITYDGQSFLIEGRRIWLVGGTINYTCVVREQWAARIHQARLAGLNAITTSVHWARHEPRPAQFDFTGDADLKHFVTLVGQAGMHCILRLGPFVGGGFDLGGLPPWLLQKEALLRTASAPYLEAASRFFGMVAKQVRDLQATAATTTAAGPIIAVQNEMGWTCGHDALSHSYLGELNRYIRESGFEVPILNANDLWAGVEGEIDTWTGSGEMLPNIRQLATVRPLQPRIVSALRVGRPAVFGRPAPAPIDAESLQRWLGECLAGGAQYNIEPFHAGSYFGFWAGRQEGPDGGFLSSSGDAGAPIDEAGRTTPLYAACRRINLFASRFGRILSSLEHRRFQVGLRPASLVEPSAPSRGTPTGPAVVHLAGAQGTIAFVFGPSLALRGKGAEQPASLLLSDGGSLPIHFGRNPLVWCLLDTRLFGRSHLDYSNLSAIALVGRVLVVAGPAGSPARLSINGAPIEIDVPAGDAPVVLEHEGIVVVICADEHLDRVQVADEAVYLNAVGLTPAGLPILDSREAQCTRISDQGVSSMFCYEDPPKGGPRKDAKKDPKKPPHPPAPILHAALAPSGRTPPAPVLGEWSFCTAHDYVDGSSARYASIAGPADLGALGAPYGYGWYRIALKGADPARVHVAWPQSADRLHLFMDGAAQGLLGEGPGAKEQITLALTRHPQSLVVLAENAGRFSGGNRMGEPCGIFGHAWQVEPLRLSKASIEQVDPMEPLSFRAPIQRLSQGDVTDSSRITWTVNRRGRHPVVLTMGPASMGGLVFINGAPHRWVDGGQGWRLYLDETVLGRGNLQISIAVMGAAEQALKEFGAALSGLECMDNITAKAEWSFAKWEKPAADLFKAGRSHRHDGPAWWRTTFVTRPGAPSLGVNCAGLSKGQAYINGKHLGRYFTASAAGHDAGPHAPLLIPGSWLVHEKPNDLLIFDEHGHTPSKVRVAFEV